MHECDVMEAGRWRRHPASPKQVVGRRGAADRLASILESIDPEPEDTRRSEDEIIVDAVSKVAEIRRARRNGDA